MGASLHETSSVDSHNGVSHSVVFTFDEGEHMSNTQGSIHLPQLLGDLLGKGCYVPASFDETDSTSVVAFTDDDASFEETDSTSAVAFTDDDVFLHPYRHTQDIW